MLLWCAVTPQIVPGLRADTHVRPGHILYMFFQGQKPEKDRWKIQMGHLRDIQTHR